MKLRAFIVMLMVCSLGAGGCQFVRKKFPKLMRLELPQSPQQVEELSQLRYPRQAPIGDDWDIIVLRDGRSIELVNRTARSYSDLHLWLNRRYVAPVESIRIGSGNRKQLSLFVDRHRESFPIGALLAPDKARPLVSADLFDQTTGLRHRLVVRAADN